MYISFSNMMMWHVLIRECKTKGFTILCDKMYICFSNMMMWHVLIGECKPKGLHQFLIKFNLFEKLLTKIEKVCFILN